MTEDLHVLGAERAGGTVSDNVTLGPVVEDGICPAVRKESAIGATRKSIENRTRRELTKNLPAEDLLVGVFVNVTQAEALVAHLRKHARLVGGIDLAVVVVRYGAEACPRRR